MSSADKVAHIDERYSDIDNTHALQPGINA